MKLYLRDYINKRNILENVEQNKAISFFETLSEHEDSEFILSKNRIHSYYISFSNIIFDKWKIDHPIELGKIHKQCYATKEQCIAIIRELYKKGNIDDVPGFIDVPIQDFTLDEMIEFKKEEEMMLRGEDPFMEEEKEDLTTETATTKEKKEIVQQPEIKGNKETTKKVPAKKDPIKTVKKDNKSDNYFHI